MASCPATTGGMRPARDDICCTYTVITDPARLAEHLQITSKSEQKKIFGARFATPRMALGPMCPLSSWLLSCGLCCASRWQVVGDLG